MLINILAFCYNVIQSGPLRFSLLMWESFDHLPASHRALSDLTTNVQYIYLALTPQLVIESMFSSFSWYILPSDCILWQHSYKRQEFDALTILIYLSSMMHMQSQQHVLFFIMSSKYFVKIVVVCLDNGLVSCSCYVVRIFL